MSEYPIVLKEELLYSGFLRLIKRTLTHESIKTGEYVKPYVREILDVGETVCVLPWFYNGYTSDIDVILTRQMRHHGISTEAVCGFIDNDKYFPGSEYVGETAIEAGIRELQEEIGLEVTGGLFKEYGVVLPTSGIINQKTHLLTYRMTEDDWASIVGTHTSGFGGLESEGEEIEFFKVQLDVALEELDIQHPSTLLLLYKLKYEKVK